MNQDQKIKRFQELFMKINEVSKIGCCVMRDDKNFTVLTINDSLLRLIEYSKDEFKEILNNEFDKVIYEEDIEKVHILFDNILNDNRDYDLKYRIKTKSGKIRFVNEKGMIFRDSNNNRMIFSSIYLLTKYNEYSNDKDAPVDLLTYQEEISLKKYEEGVIYSYCVNIDLKRITKFSENNQLIIVNVKKGLSFLADYINDEDYKTKFIDFINFDNLKKQYSNGYNNLSFEYPIVANNNVVWIKCIVDLTLKPNTDELIAFIYAYDIVDKVLLQGMVDSLVTDDYDMLMAINIHNKTARTFKIGKWFHAPYEVFSCNKGSFDIQDIDESFNVYYTRFAIETEKIDVLKQMNLSNIIKQLENVKHYYVYCTIQGINGKIYKKRNCFQYIDNERTLICYSCIDITAIVKETEEKNQVLNQALIEANKASESKSLFLSRMSHEIRTPLNALMGYNEIAERSIGFDEKVKEYLEKSRISANHLLSLINDILDVSSIERGNIELTNTEFDFKQHIISLSNMFYNRSIEKNIYFHINTNNVKERYFYGDELRLKQILINLIGNSLKFTPKEGEIILNIFEEKEDEKYVFMQYEVIDTGIGMKKDFIEHMFEPFEQQDASITRKYGGSGLGLTITKNLIDLMHGTIEVESIFGVGSKFTVHIPLEKSDKKATNEYIFSNIKALICDDDTNFLEYIHNILDSYKVDNTCVKSKDLINKIKELNDINLFICDYNIKDFDYSNLYNLFKSYYQNKKVNIILSGNNLGEYTEKLKKLGINALLPKPIHQSKIFDLLVNMISDYDNKQIDLINYNFSSKRILLVEDNMMNVEIAKEIISVSKATIKVAYNGKEAIDTLKVDNDFDLILMDIMMPIMDGYEATKIIRKSENDKIRNIPIIAMTANAFAEDITKSLEVGMNGHLSKPIDINDLFTTLNKYLQ